MEIINDVRKALENRKVRSAWDKGVTLYALELIDELDENIRGGYYCEDDIAAPRVLEKMLLNGASDWSQYSMGGCSLIYNEEIAARLCTKSELKRTHNRECKPNSQEEWLDTQARALYQAAELIKGLVRKSI